MEDLKKNIHVFKKVGRCVLMVIYNTVHPARMRELVRQLFVNLLQVFLYVLEVIILQVSPMPHNCVE